MSEPPTLACLVRTCRRFQDLAKKTTTTRDPMASTVVDVYHQEYRFLEEWLQGSRFSATQADPFSRIRYHRSKPCPHRKAVMLCYLLFSHKGIFRDPMILGSTTLSIYRYHYLLVWKSSPLSTLPFHLSHTPFLLYYPIYVPSQSAIAYSCSYTLLSKTMSSADVSHLRNSFSFPAFLSPTFHFTKS